MVVGLLHPGEMGTSVGSVLVSAGNELLWASSGRGTATAERAHAAGFDDAGTIAALAGRADIILSICPPHAALDVATQVTEFGGIYVDANAVSPQTTRTVAERVTGSGDRFVDGGIVGPPPTAPGRTRLYLSGPAAGEVASLFSGTWVDARVLGDEIGAASALKMAYAGWSKGRAALLLAVRELAEREGVDAALLDEWALSQPDALPAWESARASARAKGWRWTGEMEQIAGSFTAAGLPGGFHRAAAAVYSEFGRPTAGQCTRTDLDVNEQT